MKESLFIHNRWLHGKGEVFVSQNPATNEIVWEGHSADPIDVDKAVHSAIKAFPSWSALSLEERYSFIQKFGQLLKDNMNALAENISKEMGKPFWESKGEIATMINKIPLSLEAYKERCPEQIRQLPNGRLLTRHKPFGALAVLAPFNFPGHLPHGHIIPALLAGNTIILKPSEFTPLVGQQWVKLWEKAGLPAGVLNLVQGGALTGKALSQNLQIEGLLFTGSYPTGLQLAKTFAESPGKILALELGGNNPLVVTDVDDLITAAYFTIQSAYLTSGQRCSCARRLIVPLGKLGDDFIETLINLTQLIQVGPYTNRPEPFMGPVIHIKAAHRVLEAQEQLLARGAKPLLLSKQLTKNTSLLSPGLIDVTTIDSPDDELFGPFLQLKRVNNFLEAIAEANNTKFGLTASLLSRDPDQFAEFYQKVNAGVINWNVATTGASSQAPFGGIGCSGNLRPSGFYAADYCSYPVAITESSTMQLPPTLTPGIQL